VGQTSAILVTGGAGYIGSHTVRHLADQGEKVIVLDNLSLGHQGAVDPAAATLVVGAIDDRACLDQIFSQHSIRAVVHFAALSLVGESVREPLRYYQNNVAAPLVLLEKMQQHDCRQFILSSTAAVYGQPESRLITEDHPTRPINPYGQSKLVLEHILLDCEKAWGLRTVALRYFNAAGASRDGRLGEDHRPETHLIPRLLMAITGQAPPLTVFGDNYDTPDGTCLRDYIHVEDLARAHALALSYLEKGQPTLRCNLGTGRGYSVKEIIAAAASVTGKSVPHTYGPQREGDPASLVAQAQLAQAQLAWQPEHREIDSMIASAWQWLTGPRQGKFS
jgi:UDP-glucose 4-epimerase